MTRLIGFTSEGLDPARPENKSDLTAILIPPEVVNDPMEFETGPLETSISSMLLLSSLMSMSIVSFGG